MLSACEKLTDAERSRIKSALLGQASSVVRLDDPELVRWVADLFADSKSGRRGVGDDVANWARGVAEYYVRIAPDDGSEDAQVAWKH